MFQLIDREVDGRVVRQTFLKPFGPGHLVLVSTTVYAAHTMPEVRMGERQRQQIMFEDVPIESITESIAFLPKGSLEEENDENVQ